jgi:uncharacterized protein
VADQINELGRPVFFVSLTSRAAAHRLGLRYSREEPVEERAQGSLRWFETFLPEWEAVLEPRGDYAAGEYEAAYKGFLPFAGHGNAVAQLLLGHMYRLGQGVPQDHGEAVRWYRLAAEQGYAVAQYSLAFMHYHGRGVREDHTEAVRWLRLAAEQGYSEAQYELGIRSDRGEGVPQAHGEAVKWYRLADEQGYADAQYNLGKSYYFGHGVREDHMEAVKWYRLAAEQGYAMAQYSLGVMYADGKGVPTDYVQAFMWLELAASRSEDPELRTGARFASAMALVKMPPDQITEAHRLVREWVEREGLELAGADSPTSDATPAMAKPAREEVTTAGTAAIGAASRESVTPRTDRDISWSHRLLWNGYRAIRGINARNHDYPRSRGALERVLEGAHLTAQQRTAVERLLAEYEELARRQQLGELPPPGPVRSRDLGGAPRTGLMPEGTLTAARAQRALRARWEEKWLDGSLAGVEFDCLGSAARILSRDDPFNRHHRYVRIRWQVGDGPGSIIEFEVSTRQDDLPAGAIHSLMEWVATDSVEDRIGLIDSALRMRDLKLDEVLRLALSLWLAPEYRADIEVYLRGVLRLEEIQRRLQLEEAVFREQDGRLVMNSPQYQAVVEAYLRGR